jgi:hypothetical protein
MMALNKRQKKLARNRLQRMMLHGAGRACGVIICISQISGESYLIKHIGDSR